MRTEKRSIRSDAWMAMVLLAAAAYNVLWGAGVILFPLLPFQLFGMESPRYPEIWQCVGMIVGVYGVGYAIAATDPLRHWPIVLVGFLGKVLGPIGFVWAVVQGTLPLSFGWIIVFNDLIWWVPFAWILWRSADGVNRNRLPEAMRLLPTSLRRTES